MEKTRNIDLENIKNKIVYGPDDYDRDAKAYAFEETLALLGEWFDELADNRFDRVNEIVRTIAAGCVPEWKTNTVNNEVQRLRIRARESRLCASLFHNYVYNIKEPSADALEGSYNGGIHK